MDPALEGLLADHDELSSLCMFTDVAGIAVQRGNVTELITARITTGSSDGPVIPDLLHVIGNWRVFRYRRDRAYFAESARTLSESAQLHIDANTMYECSQPLTAFNRNSFVQLRDSVFARSIALVTWAGANCGSKTFADLAEWQRFSRCVATSEYYHDVQDVVQRLALRQAMSGEEGRGLRFEIEPALYFLRSEWRPHDVVLHFSIPRIVNLDNARVKWHAGDARDVVGITRSGDTCTALIPTDSKTVQVTVIYGTQSLWTLYEKEEIPQTFIEHPDLDEKKDNITIQLNYERFGTTQRELRSLITKQVGSDKKLRKIVVRDIDDAIWCLDCDKPKLAAILAGGIIEAIMIARLSREAVADIQTAFLGLYPSKQVPPVASMTLVQLIAVAGRIGCIKDQKIYDGIRDWRNFVHPNRELKDGSVDTTAAGIAVHAAVRLLLGKS